MSQNVASIDVFPTLETRDREEEEEEEAVVTSWRQIENNLWA